MQLSQIIKNDPNFLDSDKFSRERKFCARCGKGVFMSEHKNRRTCGKCGDTEFI